MNTASSLDRQKVAAHLPCPYPLQLSQQLLELTDKPRQADKFTIQVQLSTQIALIQLNEGAQHKPQQAQQLHIFSYSSPSSTIACGPCFNTADFQ